MSLNPTSYCFQTLTSLKTDGVKPYIEWACGQGFAVIDVNIPKHLTGTEVSTMYRSFADSNTDLSQDDLDHADSDAKEARSKEALTLATYLWENYIE